MFQRLTDWLNRRTRGRFLEALQVEVTSRCTNRCVMCPRTVLAERWPEIDLSWHAFERTARAFPYARHVHLQGWGEPLLHPRLLDMVATAKAAGCRVGLTTNGMGLEPDTAKSLLDLGLDLLSISVAGATRDIHESIRVGSDFSQILGNVRQFLSFRAGRPGNGLKVELSYLMTRTNIAELPRAVELAASLGADELYAINLDYVVTPAHDQLRLFGCPDRREEAVRIVEEARRRARRIGLAFRSYPLDLEEVAICEAHPTKILFVSCEGWVSPCTYLTLPGQADIPRRFQGRQVSVPVVRFGNVLEEDFDSIWEGQVYRAFRQEFLRRETEAAARALVAATGDLDCEADLPPPPEPCLTCYKLYGV
ncbi:MAG: radical SAM protein [Candidatus Methylomirabilota bacterium]|jgi:MoaA/NifB/PqqE/SkfB family radical SAM enzyme